MFFFRLISRLPLGVLYLFSDVLALLLAYVLRYRRAVIQENVQKAFPEKTTAEQRAIAQTYYRNLSDLIVETLKALTISADELRRRVRVSGDELVRAYLAQGQVVLLGTSHLGNWEWSSLIAQATGIETDAVYKPLSNSFFDQLMRTIRSRFGVRPVAMQQLVRDMVTNRARPRCVGLLADQSSHRPDAAYWVPFLNQETDFFNGPEKMARQFRYPFVFVEMQREGRGRYRLTASLLAEPPYDALPPGELTRRYAERLEAAIRRDPSNWLWSHRRWKHQPESFRVPSAN
jgi:KDO2-lipid IV(A) lauroyltransferase